MKQLFILIVLTFSFVCQGQTKVYQDVNYSVITEIKGLIYLKADTTLVTGRVVRYNKKKEPKRYVIVRNGKPDNLGWTYINEKYEKPEKSALGSILTVAAVTTGLVMEVSGNNIDVPFPDSNSIKNDNTGLIENEITPLINYNKQIAANANDEMLQRNEISKNLELNENFDIVEKPSVGPYQKKYEDGQIAIEGNYIDGEMSGVWKTYYPNGIIESKGVYIKGKEDGLWDEYYENGQLKRKTIYVNGVKDGLWEQYHANGQLWGKGYYFEGRTIGEWKYYDKAGKLILIENYDD